MTRAAFVWSGAVAAGLGLGASCTDGQTAYVGLTEPIQVPGGQFIAGDLPGTPAVDGGSAAVDGGLPSLAIQTVSPHPQFVISGLPGVAISAAVAPDAVALGVRLADEGTGYWVIPAVQVVTPASAMLPAERDFSFSVNFNPSDTPGDISLDFVAIGADGVGGAQVKSPVCVESRVPDNGHACDASRPVPAAVFALRWDTDFDVDLNVIVPSGLVVNPKTQLTTVVADGGAPEPSSSPNAVGLYDGATGVIDRDSIGSCVVDGWREEDLVFQDYPPIGLYDIYANPFASCGQSSTRFTLTIYEPGPDGDLHATYTQSGELLARQTTGGGVSLTGGAATGLFVVEKQFE